MRWPARDLKKLVDATFACVEWMGATSGACGLTMVGNQCNGRLARMNHEGDDRWRSNGFRRLVNALGYSWAGVRHGLSNDSAIRQGFVALAILVPVSVLLPVSDLEHLILVLSMMLVLLVEFVNSAIESVVDRVSLERHPLAGQAKDLASVAVGIAVLMSGLCWLVIAGPSVARWVAR